MPKPFHCGMKQTTEVVPPAKAAAEAVAKVSSFTVSGGSAAPVLA